MPLFLLYINDHQCVFSRPIIRHFAEDTNLTFSIFSRKKLGNIESVINNGSAINNELKHLFQWLRGNQLSSNETKTELMILRSPWKRLTLERDIRLNNYKLKLHTHVNI